jgi:transglutaminase-like putative cysteine protease
VAVVLLVAAGAGGWSRLPGGSSAQVVPLAALAAVAAVTAALAAGWLSGRLAAGLLAFWVPAAVWTAGVPAGQLLPPAWPTLLPRLAEGVQQLTTPHSGSIGDDPWPLAAWLLGAGAIWVAGVALAASAPSSRRRAVAFVLLAVPWIAAVAVRHTDQSAWQGAAVLLAGLLWSTARHVPVRPVVALGLVAAMASVGVTQAAGPRTRWFTLALRSDTAPFRTLATDLTYGPLQGRRSGATMLEVTAAEPALWRMRVLEEDFEDTWTTSSPRSWDAAPQLPEPAARPVQVRVAVHGLRNDLVVAPGRISAVYANATASPATGQAWQLTPPPRPGDTYQLRASVVHATAQQLQDAPAPTDARARHYTTVHVRPAPSYTWRMLGVPLFGQPPDPRVTAVLERTPYGPVAALARQLAAGATTQWDMVTRVHRHLLDGDRFRYTTNVPAAGGSAAHPVVDFLLRDHAGYCQHFAGAAALLLRLAGVPTRVVVGFAPGIPKGDGRFQVRDSDAHAWIEVYFQGYGWVAFNPTPPAAPAHIPRQLDPLGPAPATITGGHHVCGRPGALAVGALLVALATAGAVIVRGRRRGRRAELGHLLEDLVRRIGGHVETSRTLAELGAQLLGLVGPNTAALAAHAERARFAPHPPTPAPHPRIQIARALARDVGPMRALLVLVAPAGRRRPRTRPPRTG